MALLRERYDKLVQATQNRSMGSLVNGYVDRRSEILEGLSESPRNTIEFASRALLLSQYIKLGLKRWDGFTESVIHKAQQYPLLGVGSSPEEQASEEVLQDKTLELERRVSNNYPLERENTFLNSFRLGDLNRAAVKGDKPLESVIYLANVDNSDDRVEIYTIPREISYGSESTHAVIKPMGRNNPLYQYIGSEDRVEFEISWYKRDYDNDQVIRSCRQLEAFSKADGYGNKKLVTLIWGDTNRLFGDHTFVVLEAPYILHRFSRAHINKTNQDGIYTDDELMPVRATQKIVLARVSTFNLKHEDIVRVGAS